MEDFNNSVIDIDFKEPLSSDINELKKLKQKLINNKSDKSSSKLSQFKLMRRNTLLSDDTINNETNDIKNDITNENNKILKVSVSRKNFIEDITKQLESLTDVQNSANDMLSNFQKILDSKNKNKNNVKNEYINENNSKIINNHICFESQDHNQIDGMNLLKELNMTRNFDEEDDVPLIDDNEFDDLKNYQFDNNIELYNNDINKITNSESEYCDNNNINQTIINHKEDDLIKYEYYSSGSDYEEEDENEFLFTKSSENWIINSKNDSEYLLGSDYTDLSKKDEVENINKNDFQLEELSGLNITTDESHLTEETSGYSMSSSLSDVMKSHTAKLLLNNISVNNKSKYQSKKSVHKAFVVIEEDDL